MRRFSAVLILLAFCSGCAFGGSKKPPRTQLEIRQSQTRTYEAKDTKLVMKAVLNVLQDEGYSIKNANTELGLLTAIKEKNASGGLFGGIFGSSGKDENRRYKKLEQIEATANVSAHGKQTKVRVTFQKKSIDNFGDTMDVRPIQKESFYQNFFIKVDKGIFLEKREGLTAF